MSLAGAAADPKPGYRPPPTPPARPAPLEPPNVPQEIAALGQLMAVMGQDPKYRTKLMEMVREYAPDLPIPELDIEQNIRARVDADTKVVKADHAKLAERLSTMERSIARDRWAMEHGLSDEEMDELESFAKEKKIGDSESAFDYFRKSGLGRPRGTSAPVALSDESRKALYKDPRAWALKQGEDILAQMRRGGRRGA